MPIDDKTAAEIEVGVRLGLETMSGLIDRLAAHSDSADLFLEIADVVGPRISALIAEQASWARPTDAERLVTAFETLSGVGIIARHACKGTRSEAAAQLQRDAHGAVGGYVFYTFDDARALLDGRLDLTWEAAADADADEVALRAVVVPLVAELRTKLQN